MSTQTIQSLSQKIKDLYADYRKHAGRNEQKAAEIQAEIKRLKLIIVEMV